MKPPPPFILDEDLFTGDDEAIESFAMDRVGEDELRLFYQESYREYLRLVISLDDYCKAGKEVFPSGWAMGVKNKKTGQILRVDSYYCYRANPPEHLPYTRVY